MRMASYMPKFPDHCSMWRWILKYDYVKEDIFSIENNSRGEEADVGTCLKSTLVTSFCNERQIFQYTEPSNLGADAAQQLTGDKYKASEANPLLLENDPLTAANF